MSTPETNGPVQLSVDTENLYREEVFTDLKAATVRRLSPVRPDGSPDPGRPVLFLGETQILTPAGLLPVQARIPAKTLEEAWERFPEAIRRAVDRLIQEVREAQLREATRIVTPAEAGLGLGGGELRGPGVPGGGKIKLP